MSYVLLGKDSDLHLQLLPDGYQIKITNKEISHETKPYEVASDKIKPYESILHKTKSCEAILPLAAAPFESKTGKEKNGTNGIGNTSEKPGLYCPLDFGQMAENGYYSLDLFTGKYTVWNDNVAKIYGVKLRTTEEIQNFFRDLGTLIIPEDQKKFVDAMKTARETGQYAITYRIKLPDGNQKTIVACGQVIYDINDKPAILMILNQVKVNS